MTTTSEMMKKVNEIGRKLKRKKIKFKAFYYAGDSTIRWEIVNQQKQAWTGKVEILEHVSVDDYVNQFVELANSKKALNRKLTPAPRRPRNMQRRDKLQKRNGGSA